MSCWGVGYVGNEQAKVDDIFIPDSTIFENSERNTHPKMYVTTLMTQRILDSLKK